MADSTVSDAQRKEIERLRSEHPDYSAMKHEWQFFLSAYEGGITYLNGGNLFKHQRENFEDFQDRITRATYANYCQPLVDFVPEFIYSQGVQRTPPDEIKEDFVAFRKDVDRAGTDLDAFMTEVAEDARIFGHTWVGIDKPPRPDDIPEGQEISDARAKKLGLTIPYFYHVRPIEVLDWVTDQFGNYLYMKRREFLSERKKGGGYRRIEKFTEWEKDTVKISKIDLTDTDSERLLPKIKQPNPWNLIPFVQFFYKRSKVNKDMGVSFIQDIARQNRDIFNQTSYLQEFLARQCFNVLAMEQNTQVPTRDRTDGRIGNSNVIWIPREAKHVPQYVSPPVEPAEFIHTERQNTVREMYRQAAQDIMAEVFAGGDVPSADAQKQAFSRTIPMIAKMADQMQYGEISLWTIWSTIQDKTWETGEIAYRDDYSVTNIQDLCLQLSTIFNNLKVLPPTFIREEWRRIIREFDGKIPGPTLATIYEEIDALSDDELIQGYLQSDIKAMGGVPSTANLIQGQTQRLLGTDVKIAAEAGSKAATKEANPDSNRRAKTAKKAKKA